MNKQNRDFQAYVGHLLDIYRIAAFKFRNPHSWTKYRHIKSWQELSQKPLWKRELTWA
jgi:hypothetical protein